ncbi:MAG: hypothetical protein WA419_00090 [Silvibacterium sp.]
MKKYAVLFIAGFLLPAGFAQSTPTLHQRNEVEPGPQTHAAKGVSTLPDAASGEYELDGNGSVVQITLDENRLTGYVTKMEQGASLTLLFDRTTIDRNRLTFTTKAVHGLWYSFAGTIERGNAASASQTGFYRLNGDWTTHHDGGREMGRVSLKSTPRLNSEMQ